MESSQITPLISVVVPTYNRADLLSGCLFSLAEQTIDKDQYEVIVVDNNSTDETIRVANKFCSNQPNFRVVTETVQGHSQARNRGWREAQGAYVAYLDDDARAHSDWCRRIIDAFSHICPKPVAVGGRIYPWYMVAPPSWFLDDFEIRTWGNKKKFLDATTGQYGFSGSNMAFQKNILELYGGFSSKYGMVGGELRMGEDTELFIRIHKSYPLFWYDPEITVEHYTPSRNMKFSYRYQRYYNIGKSLALMNGAKSNLRYIREVLFLAKFVMREPLWFFTKRKGMLKTRFYYFIGELGGMLGSLLCPLYRLRKKV